MNSALTYLACCVSSLILGLGVRGRELLNGIVRVADVPRFGIIPEVVPAKLSGIRIIEGIVRPWAALSYHSLWRHGQPSFKAVDLQGKEAPHGGGG